MNADAQLSPVDHEPMTSLEHDWIRTIPTDGRWCEACGLSEAQDRGDPCPGSGAARVVEAKMVAKVAKAVAAERAQYADEYAVRYANGAVSAPMSLGACRLEVKDRDVAGSRIVRRKVGPWEDYGDAP